MSTLFKYITEGGAPVTHLDPEDVYTAEDLRKHWVQTFPALGNCQVEEKKAKEGEILEELTAEGEKVQVTRLITYVKKIGTKGATLYRFDGQQWLDEDDLEIEAARDMLERHYQAPYSARRGHYRAEVGAGGLVDFQGQQVEVGRVVALVKQPGRITPSGDFTMGLPDAARPSIAAQVRAWEAANEEAQAKAAVARAARAVVLRATAPDATEEDRDLFYGACEQARIIRRLADNAPRLLAALREAKETLETVLEVAIFVNGNRQVVIDRLARLEAVIAEVEGEGAGL